MNVEKFELANKWIRLLNKKISVLQSLNEMGITQIIMYGASEFALRLLEQCENEDSMIKVIGIADKRIHSKGEYYNGIPLLSIDDIMDLNMDDVCVVITAMGFCEEITEELKGRGIKKIVSLKEMIYAVYC